jgi:hypothetical protein
MHMHHTACHDTWCAGSTYCYISQLGVHEGVTHVDKLVPMVTAQKIIVYLIRTCRLCARHEGHGDAVHAVAHVCGRWAVIKHVPQVALALFAPHLSPRHKKDRVVGHLSHSACERRSVIALRQTTAPPRRACTYTTQAPERGANLGWPGRRTASRCRSCT